MSQGTAKSLKAGRGNHTQFLFAQLKNGAVYVYPHRLNVKGKKQLRDRIEENHRRLVLKHWIRVRDRSGNNIPGWSDRLPAA